MVMRLTGLQIDNKTARSKLRQKVSNSSQKIEAKRCYVRKLETKGRSICQNHRSVEMLSEFSLYEFQSHPSVTIESGSKLSRMEAGAFGQSRLVEIVIPASVEILGELCFYEYRSISSVTIESGSILSRIECEVFSKTGLIQIIFPASVENFM
jgi:hypothetical protein